MGYVEMLYARRNQYANELVLAQAKLAVVEDLIADIEAAQAPAEETTEQVADETY